MIEYFPDIIGTVGVFIILMCYCLIQMQRISIESALYSWLNLLGSTLISISLIFHWNTPSFIIEMAWGSISIWGIIRAYRRKAAS